MARTCKVCGAEFESKSKLAKYCSERCKKRAQRAPRRVDAEPDANAETAFPTMPNGMPSLTVATATELAEAGRLNTAAGVSALLLAVRLDQTTADTGSSIAALVREHRAALAKAVEGAATLADPIDELRSRRDVKRAAG